MEKLGANRPNLGNTPNPPPPPSLNQPLSTSTPYRGIFLPASHINEINEKMAAPTPMMDSGLIGVALIIRSNQGPRWVYHYPPHPTLDGPQRDENLWGTNLFEQPVEDEDDDDQYALKDEDLEGEITERKHKFSKFGVSLTKAFLSGSHVQDSEELEDDEHYDDQWGKQHVPWEQVFEFDVADLQSILTPQKAFHKKKFELCLDPYYFVSYPIHIREDGGWKKKKPKKSKKGKEKEVEDEEADAGPSGKKANNNSENGDEHGGITMFNVVFILDAEKQKIDDKIATIYEHVVKTLNKALHHAQAHGDYVWKESEMILAMKEKAKEERRPMSWLWSEIAIRSTLAAAIRDVYIAVSENRIATVQLGTTPPLNLSLQIPVPYFLTSIPSRNERAMPGLLITGANPWVKGDREEDEAHLDENFALLLMEDEDKIIAEITNDNTELSYPMLMCIQHCKPTLSFAQVAENNKLTIESLLQVAQHLIHFRRAIAIPPLHLSDHYMINPNCDSRKLPEACLAWKKKFPLSPNLSHFLSRISTEPKKYKDFVPTRDHRPTYLNMLAWLIRGGWVVQLRTVAWVLVWPEIMYEVEYQLKGEAIEKAKKKAALSTSGESAGETDESDPDKKYDDPNAPMTTEEVAESARLSRLEQKLAQIALEAEAEFAKMPIPVATDNITMNEGEHLQPAPYIIKDPHKVTHEESLYIAAIGKRFEDEKTREMWGKLTKYFNGDDALEMIALKEKLRRKLVWSYIMGAFQEHIMIAKHF